MHYKVKENKLNLIEYAINLVLADLVTLDLIAWLLAGQKIPRILVNFAVFFKWATLENHSYPIDI